MIPPAANLVAERARLYKRNASRLTLHDESAHGSRTDFSILKPDVVRRNLTGAVNALIEAAGLRIVAQKRLQMTRAQAETFYAVHKERPFFGELVEMMTAAPVVVQVLEGENAILKYREVMGATNPAKADPGTIRKDFALSMGENSVHGSDAPETAAVEIAQFFAGNEIVGLSPLRPFSPRERVRAGRGPSASRRRCGRPLEEGRLHLLGGLAQVRVARFSPRPAGVEIGLEAIAQRPVLGEQIEAGLLDRCHGVSQLRLGASDLRQHQHQPAFGAVPGEFARQPEGGAQIVARSARGQEHDVAVLGDFLRQKLARPRVSTTMYSIASSLLRSFFRLLKARASMSGSTAFFSRSAFHSTQVSCSRSKSASSVRCPRCAAPTANNRASVLFPTPPFWLTKLTVRSGFFSLLMRAIVEPWNGLASGRRCDVGK